MDENDEDVESVVEWQCPACETDMNSEGGRLVSSWAVACHVGGKMYSGDRLHKSWALSRVGESINEPSVKRSVYTLALALEWAVAEDNRKRREDESEKFRRWMEEKQAAEAPDVQAYRHIKEVETSLHEFVRRTLEKSFGQDEDGWWVQGIPVQVRTDCAKRREEDPNRREMYTYTYLIDLRTIIDKRWSIFGSYFQHVMSKGELLESIARLNDLRNIVFHPPCDIPVSAEDLSFLRWFCDLVRNL